MKEIGAMIDPVMSTDQEILTEEGKTCSSVMELRLLWLIRLFRTLLPMWLDNHKTWADKVDRHRHHRTATGLDLVDHHLTTITWVDPRLITMQVGNRTT